MDDLDIFRTRGRATKPLNAAIVRELDLSDLALLQEEKGSEAPLLKRLSQRHHALARALAGGAEPSVAAITCGYVLSRVSILQSDPAFRELVEFYRRDVEAQYLGIHEKLAGVAGSALDEIQERLEENPADLSITALLEIAKMGADRTGAGPQSSSTNINVNVDLASRMEQARRRVAERSQVIDG